MKSQTIPLGRNSLLVLQARPGEAVEQFGGRLVQPDTGVLRINLLSALNFLTAKMSHGPTCA